jgi:hypothetical protein
MPNTKAKRPNIIFLSIDSVRYDHTSLGNYVHPTTPNLDKMQQNALSCPTTFSLGPFTQSACIQKHTKLAPSFLNFLWFKMTVGRQDDLLH